MRSPEEEALAIFLSGQAFGGVAHCARQLKLLSLLSACCLLIRAAIMRPGHRCLIYWSYIKEARAEKKKRGRGAFPLFSLSRPICGVARNVARLISSLEFIIQIRHCICAPTVASGRLVAKADSCAESGRASKRTRRPTSAQQQQANSGLLVPDLRCGALRTVCCNHN